ncbi:MAG: hypothetical protein JNJ69_11680, partial [Leptospiraceae bacterium]|nr:hypothetical protein [Leptospiraceae bacterium]
MQAATSTYSPMRQYWLRIHAILWQSLTRRGVLAVLASLVLTGFYVVLYWSYDIDALYVQRQQHQILSSLDKKIAVAERSGVAALRGLQDQKKFIFDSLSSGNYHAYLLPENRIFV